MGIRDIPPSFEAFDAWSTDFAKTHFCFAETNRKIGKATRDLFASWFPRVFAPVVHYSIYALLDDSMLQAFGFPRPLPLTRQLIGAGLRLRGAIAGLLPSRRKPHFFTDDRNRTHPNGYDIEALGPPRLVRADRRRQPSDTPTD
jgi:hypothetical protein